MKIKGAKKVHYDSGPNMTPLVDVVMVILIFLMLAGSFEQGRVVPAEQHADQEGGRRRRDAPKPGTIPDEPLDIRVDNSPDGFRVVAGDIRSTGDRDSLKAALEQKLQAIRGHRHPRRPRAGRADARPQREVRQPDHGVRGRASGRVHQGRVRDVTLRAEGVNDQASMINKCPMTKHKTMKRKGCALAGH